MALSTRVSSSVPFGNEISHTYILFPAYFLDVRFVFDASDDCTIVHSALYSCLRAVFGLSVAGVLVAVFSCMLVYQLLSHERKKMYWEQLELRCRSLYGAHPHPGPHPALAGGPSVIEASRAISCRCCEQCHSHRNMMQPAFGWENDARMWPAGPGGNFYAPNPAREDHSLGDAGNRPSSHRPGWSWPRFPWQRSDGNNQRFRQQPSSPDSQYGFSNHGSAMMPQAASYAMINGNIQHYGIWGPPPPYSDPNSPARRNRYFGMQTQCAPISIDHQAMVQTIPAPQSIHQNPVMMECHTASIESHNYVIEQGGISQAQTLNRQRKTNACKMKDAHDGSLHSGNEPREIQSNTLPFRKTKKRNEVTSKSIRQHVPSSRVNIRYVFNSAQNRIEEPDRDDGAGSSSDSTNNSKRRDGGGVDNSAFRGIEQDDKCCTMNESEIYFGDTSSCCNSSAKNINLHECNDEQSQMPAPSRLHFSSVKAKRNAGHMPKDMSRQSMCSMDSGEKTDYTDLSPLTPTTPIGRLDNNHRSNSQYGRPPSVYNEPSSSTSHLAHNYPRGTRKYNELLLSAETRESRSSCSSLNSSMRSRQGLETYGDGSQLSMSNRVCPGPKQHARNERIMTPSSRSSNENKADLMFIDSNSDSEDDTGNNISPKNDKRL